ncbi:hypothetical protein [Pseudomonas syringae group sp. J254-4]|uniref:hypothetical protein n=1 Tax=Pseudomonas syringae group sp. J254-4 TaxID=3079589 RepID=UPI002906EF7C|nr:hypothetical protein [Pseudomonas syringae group sp. J254-4]MDU8454847.1 hypothetical protein [Pseudomonas syringae group sp. J254-4]
MYESAEILSEALGYTMAKLVDLPVAKTAGVIELTPEQMPDRVRQILKNMSTKGEQKTYLAWFSEDTTYPNLYQKHAEGFPKFLEDRRAKRLALALSKNKSIPSIVSFDSWLQNSDRHLANLLWSTGGKYVLIDHGRIFGWADWKPHSLIHRHDPPNRLMATIDRHAPNWSASFRVRGARLLAYNGFSVAFKDRGIALACEILGNFLDDRGSALVVDFLFDRLDNSRYSKELGMLAIS